MPWNGGGYEVLNQTEDVTIFNTKDVVPFDLTRMPGKCLGFLFL